MWYVIWGSFLSHTRYPLVHCHASLYQTLASLWSRSAVSSLLEWTEIPLKP